VIARLPGERLPDAGRAIESGVAGVQLSNVTDPEQVRAARAAMMPAPAGHLSLSLSHRAAGFGAGDPAAYLARLAGELVLVAQIESRAGIDALGALLAAPGGPDAWFLGPMDLSADLGHPGQPRHPDVRSALLAAAAVIMAAGATLGVFALDGDDADDWRRRGARLVVLGSDVAMLAGQARALTGRWRSRSPGRG
jgi:4-hydroxy-2-oxoheptanedioate aldolase